ncbi:hypothetical protein V3I05_05530 [Helicobacter mastomyrinus]|uniref:Uncharacterized protein n=1 Tax=Helicobacter mastomyrinus TaxID=287948 RepID=A0ABZ3F4N4_9HELI|nr:hypothetical protein [uncultured Helicobacter sp.]
MLKELAVFFIAAFFEILGCFSFWAVFKLQKSPYFLILGVICVIAFAFLLTKGELEFAGRAYAIYGGVYIASSFLWLYIVEKQSFNIYDIVGVLFVCCGILIILFGAKITHL